MFLSTHWSFIKFCFKIPFVLTSSTMCIINSISEDANSVKVPTIIVNAVTRMITMMIIIVIIKNPEAGQVLECTELNETH
jgi:uncharacterized protein with PQ loop repeat